MRIQIASRAVIILVIGKRFRWFAWAKLLSPVPPDELSLVLEMDWFDMI
jgi:hypothetical protein